MVAGRLLLMLRTWAYTKGFRREMTIGLEKRSGMHGHLQASVHSMSSVPAHGQGARGPSTRQGLLLMQAHPFQGGPAPVQGG